MSPEMLVLSIETPLGIVIDVARYVADGEDADENHRNNSVDQWFPNI